MTTEKIIENNDGDLVEMSSDSIVEIARSAEARIEAVKKIKTLSLRVTSSHDWIDMGGKPYLAVSGSEKIARLFGVSWTIDEPSIEVNDDGHFQYTYKGVFSFKGHAIEAIGCRSSTDPFFSRKSVWTNGEKRAIDIEPSKIDRGDVKKAAYTNCIGNGLTRLLGLRGMTWEELQANGIQPGAAVAFKKPEVPKGAVEPNGAKRDDDAPATEKQTKMVWARVKGLGMSDDESKSAIKSITGKSSSKEMTHGDIQKMVEWTDKKSVEMKAAETREPGSEG